jgi:hypothetical protein
MNMLLFNFKVFWTKYGAEHKEPRYSVNGAHFSPDGTIKSR